MSQPLPSSQPLGRPLRVLVLSLVSSIVFLTVAVVLAVPAEGAGPDPVGVAAALAAVVATALVARAVGFRTTPLEPTLSSADAQREALARFQTSTVLRFAITEAGFLVTVALTFALDEGPWPVAVAAAPAAVLLYLNCWPSRATVDRFAARLEASGARSGLREAFGHA